MHKTDELPEPEKSPAEAGQKLVFGNAEKEKAAKRRTKKDFLFLLFWGKIGGKLPKYPEYEAKTSENSCFSLVLVVTPTGLEPMLPP